MAARGRPRSARAASARIVRIKLRLYPGEDEDLIAFFTAVPHRLRAAMVKRALRSGVLTESEDIATEDDELLKALDAFVD